MSRLSVAPHSASTFIDADETGAFLPSHPGLHRRPQTETNLARFAVTATPAAASDTPVPVSAIGLSGQPWNRACGRGVADRSARPTATFSQRSRSSNRSGDPMVPANPSARPPLGNARDQ